VSDCKGELFKRFTLSRSPVHANPQDGETIDSNVATSEDKTFLCFGRNYNTCHHLIIYSQPKLVDDQPTADRTIARAKATNTTRRRTTMSSPPPPSTQATSSFLPTSSPANHPQPPLGPSPTMWQQVATSSQHHQWCAPTSTVTARRHWDVQRAAPASLVNPTTSD
jgi:hypothetical protein